HLGHAVQVLLVVLLVALALGLAVVVFLEQFRLARLGLLQFGLQHGARAAVALALLGAVDLRAAGRGRAPGARSAARGRCRGGRTRALHDGDVAALDQLAAASLRLGGVVGVFVAAAP